MALYGNCRALGFCDCGLCEKIDNPQHNRIRKLGLRPRPKLEGKPCPVCGIRFKLLQQHLDQSICGILNKK